MAALSAVGCSNGPSSYPEAEPPGQAGTTASEPERGPGGRQTDAFPKASGKMPAGLAESERKLPNGGIPPDEIPPSAAGHPYPERNDVVAMLHRARELHDRFQFQAALDLVGRALEADPQSPAARELERQLVELLQRVRDVPAPRPGTEFRVALRQD